MAEAPCINCCVPVSKKSMIFDTLFYQRPSPSSEPIMEKIVVTSILNYIYKGTGQKMPEVGDREPIGLCTPCWTVVLELFKLHKKLEELTKLDSLINQTFHLLDPVVQFVKQEPGVVPVPTVKTKSGRSNSKNKNLVAVPVKKSLRSKDSREIPVNLNQPPKHENSSNAHVEEMELEPEFELYEDNTSEMEFDNYLSDLCDPSAQSPSTSENPEIHKDKQNNSEICPKSRYSGPCSEPDCTHVFEYATKQRIRNHFRAVHGREIKIHKVCHVCEEPLKGKIHESMTHLKSHDTDGRSLVNNCTKFNAGILRSTCGLNLTTDAIKGHTLFRTFI